eukprot:294830-Pelagomonas_calceolata.AAC.5
MADAVGMMRLPDICTTSRTVVREEARTKRWAAVRSVPVAGNKWGLQCRERKGRRADAKFSADALAHGLGQPQRLAFHVVTDHTHVCALNCALNCAGSNPLCSRPSAPTCSLVRPAPNCLCAAACCARTHVSLQAASWQSPLVALLGGFERAGLIHVLGATTGKEAVMIENCDNDDDKVMKSV